MQKSILLTIFTSTGSFLHADTTVNTTVDDFVTSIARLAAAPNLLQSPTLLLSYSLDGL